MFAVATDHGIDVDLVVRIGFRGSPQEPGQRR
jgi:hypothetical protein